MNIVVGSGPAGVACTQALLDQGKEVLMLDAGLTQDAPQQDLLTRIQSGDAEAARRLIALQADLPVSSHGVPRKLAHGSDFPYRDVEDHLGFDGNQAALLPSLARGGLSNVWGAAILPFRSRDLAGWPITTDELAPHYRAVTEMTGCSGQPDNLSTWYPFHTERVHPLKPSSQASDILAGLQRDREALRREGILFGTSRLAVGPNRSQRGECVYCGQCLYGCPYGVIYNSAHDLPRFQAEAGGRFTYRANTIVDRITETGAGVRAIGYDRLTRAPIEFEAGRAFVAAGTIPSSRLMLKSLEAYDRPLTLLDSQYFLLPLLSRRGRMPAETLYTLSQIFLEMEDEKISPFTVHLQIYTYNDLLSRVLRARLRLLPGLRQLLVPLLDQRLILVQGYLHSAHSGRLALTLGRDRDGRERLKVASHPNPEARDKIGHVLRKLARPLRRLGLLAIRPGLEVTLPGRGFHSGGSFPMRQQPGAFESDWLGRVGGAARTHVVDASIFPSIPATPITLGSMANAHRIGSAAISA